ncbi:hypothetical protein LCGC14_0981640 [marine sediment metagenome]|uniref:CopG-like ribbon-helix-helix domain-containing protein n=1 Tax=marine sediment metagenome TaxID=412755 RepID=A0A0F9QRY1_9ZZZZ
MGRPVLYPEGRAQMNVIVPKNVKRGFEKIARQRTRSVSQVITIILRSYLQEHGELPEREEVKA